MTPMRARIMRAAKALVFMILAVPLAGCETLSSSIESINPFATKGPQSDIGPEAPAEVLFNDGLARLNDRNYDAAAKKFAEVDKQYPYSSWSRRALILQAFAKYEERDYEDAIGHARRYVQLYPSSAEAPYAQYLVGMSHFNRIIDISRDQDRAEQSWRAMEELVRKWPRSEYVGDAKERIRIARDQLAGKEMEIGRFYLSKRNFPAAVNRFREVLVKYQTTRHAEEALSRLAEAYMALGIVGEAQTAGAVLGHNFPDGQWYKDTYALLQSGGLEPREDQGSWISRTFKGFTRTVGL